MPFNFRWHWHYTIDCLANICNFKTWQFEELAIIYQITFHKSERSQMQWRQKQISTIIILFYIYFYYLQSHNKKGQPLILPLLVEPCFKLLTWRLPLLQHNFRLRFLVASKMYLCICEGGILMVKTFRSLFLRSRYGQDLWTNNRTGRR